MAKNKLQKFAEMEALSNVFQYPYAVLQAQGGCPLKGRWHAEVFKNNRPIVLELGCGRGEYTVGLGRLFPEKNFIGIDIKGARMWAGAKEAFRARMKNVAFLRTEIERITHFFTPGEIAELWLTFPDPQMKKGNKRLTSPRFMRMYSDILCADGLIHLKTDSLFLFTYTVEMIKSNGLLVQACTDNLYLSGAADDILSIRTFYEQQWIERGLNIKYLRFVCQPRETWIEPDADIEPDAYRSYNRSRRGDSQVPKQDNI